MKKIPAFLIIICTFYLLSSCSGRRYKEIDLPSTYFNDETITITVEIPWFVNVSDGIFSLIRLYDSMHPEIKVQGGVQADLKMLQKLKYDFSTGKFPDVFTARPSAFIEKLIEQGMLVELNSVFLDDRDWYRSFLYRQLWKTVRSDGRAYGLPVSAGYGCMVLNRDAFSSRIQYPETLDDLKRISSAVSAEGYVLFRADSPGELRQLICSLMVIYSEGLNRNSSSAEIRQAFVKSISFLRKLAKSGALEAGHLVPNSRYTASDREAAVYFIQDISDRFIREQDKYIYRAYPSRLDQADRQVVFSPGPLTFYISRDSQRSMPEEEAILDFLHFITCEGSIIYQDNGEYLINVKTDLLEKDKFFTNSEIKDKYSRLLQEGTEDVSGLFLDDYKTLPDADAAENKVLKTELIKTLEQNEYNSIPVDYFFPRVLDLDFGIGAAGLLVGNADAGAWWDSFVAYEPEYADAR